MPRGLKHEEADDAAWEAARGAATGAARWGFYTGLAGCAGYAFSPLYRGLTIQFKVFIQMSGMVLGSMIEADKRLRLYETQVRLQKRQRIDRAVWERYERELEELERGGGGAGSGIVDGGGKDEKGGSGEGK